MLLFLLLAGSPEALPAPRPFDPSKPLLGTLDRHDGEGGCQLFEGADDGKKGPVYLDDGETALLKIRGAEVELPLDPGHPFVEGGRGTGKTTDYKIRDVSIHMVWRERPSRSYRVEITVTQPPKKQAVTASGRCE